MSRIHLVTNETATQEQQALFDAIQSQLGVVPNFLKIFANSPVALKSFLGLYGVANEGSLDPLTRERIALAMAQQNSCEYCLSAHTALGKKAGLSNDEITANRAGTCSLTAPRSPRKPSPKAATPVSSARTVRTMAGP